MNIDRATAHHVLALWPNPNDPAPSGGYLEPVEADRLLYMAAGVLEGNDLLRLELVFPRHVAAVRMLKSDDGRDVLRALAVAGVA